MVPKNELETYLTDYYTFMHNSPVVSNTTATIAATPMVTQPLKNNISDCCSYVYATAHDLDKMARKIYKIIEEHCCIDITEEEFMELLKED